ncbi:hypothetical protein D3C75_1195150 [compost metagenome]
MGKLGFGHGNTGKSLLGLASEVWRMIGNTDDCKPRGDTGFNIVPDRSVSMAAAEMMGMQVEFHG